MARILEIPPLSRQLLLHERMFENPGFSKRIARVHGFALLNDEVHRIRGEAWDTDDASYIPVE